MKFTTKTLVSLMTIAATAIAQDHSARPANLKAAEAASSTASANLKALRSDATTPITPSAASAFEDRPPLTKSAPKIELGRFSADGTEFHFDKDTGNVIVESQFKGLRLSKKDDDQIKFQSIKMEDFTKLQMRGIRSSNKSNAAVEGSAPRHLAVHAGAPDDETGASTRAVFGEDDRYAFQDTSYPYSTVGRVSSSRSICTGTMIGPRHVLTTATCATGDYMTFTPSYFDGYAPFGTAKVSWVIDWDVVDTSDGFSDHEVAFDYAVLVLDHRIGDLTGWMGARSFFDSWIGGKYWSHIGYPGGRPFYSSEGSVWTATEYTNGGVEGKLLGNFIDTEEGHAGGPLYAYWTGEDYPSIIGVQSSYLSNHYYSPTGDINEAAGGQGMVDLVIYAKNEFP